MNWRDESRDISDQWNFELKIWDSKCIETSTKMDSEIGIKLFAGFDLPSIHPTLFYWTDQFSLKTS